MSENGATLPQDTASAETGFAEVKGKGKAPSEEVRDAAMDEDDEDDEDDEEDDEEEDGDEGDNAGGDDEDGMEEIDLGNIVEGGRRTRGAKIDFAKAAEENPADEEDEEDDDDFEPPQDTEMSG
ncbi:Histone chaperone domain CHZ [Lecanicillium sp. MT-2017a]|nr:Histone chaperone domain CHZ [Lecanicillium sp. MT-2017a]